MLSLERQILGTLKMCSVLALEWKTTPIWRGRGHVAYF